MNKADTNITRLLLFDIMISSVCLLETRSSHAMVTPFANVPSSIVGEQSKL